MQPSWLDQDNGPNERASKKDVFFSGMLLALFISTVAAVTCGLAIGYEWYAYASPRDPRLGLEKGLLVGVSAGTSSASLIFVGYWLCRSWGFAFMIAAALAVTRGITIALSMTDNGEKARGFEEGLKAGVGTFLVSALILTYVMKQLKFSRDLIRPLEVSKYEWGEIKWGFGAGLLIFVGFYYLFGFGFDRGFAFGLLGGAVVGGVAVLSGTPDPAPVKPNQRILQSGQHALRMGTWMAIFGALCFGLVYGYAHNAVAGIVNGILGLVFFIVSMFFGGFPVVQHYGLRLALWREGVIPLSWVKFLDYASDRHLLRKVGGGYTFWHEELREYFKEFYGRTTGSTAKGGHRR